MRIVAIIPAHLASVRLKQKILLKIKGLEMIEHVRRRAILSALFDRVIVATGDQKIENLIKSYKGEVIKTKKVHFSGTSRVAEAVENIEATHVVIIQGDEPLMLTEHLTKLVNAIKINPNYDTWNATATLSSHKDLDKHSFVKCVIGRNNKIIYCFRRTPSFAEFNIQTKYVKKILGLIAFKKEVILELSNKPQTMLEKIESIEQLKILSYGFDLFSVSVHPSLPSINEPGDEEILLNYLKNNKQQKELVNLVLNMQT